MVEFFQILRILLFIDLFSVAVVHSGYLLDGSDMLDTHIKRLLSVVLAVFTDQLTGNSLILYLCAVISSFKAEVCLFVALGCHFLG